MTRRALIADTRGAVYAEFLIAFVPIFIMFLGVVQIALAHAAKLTVQHAAAEAARAAVVVLSDDPEAHWDEHQLYYGEHVGQLDGDGETEGDSLLAAFVRGTGSTGTGSARVQAIRAAASAPLLGIAPSEGALETYSNDAGWTGSIGSDPRTSARQRGALGGRLDRRIEYNRFAVGVSFPGDPGADPFQCTDGKCTGLAYGPNDEITVRVTYLFHCGVPVVNYLGLCKSLGDIQTLEEGAYATELSSPGPEFDPFTPVLNSPLPGNHRYIAMHAEATLRNQGALYDYRGDPAPPVP